MEKAVAANLKYAVTAFFIIQWYKRGAAYDHEGKYHDFGLPIVKSMLFFSNVRTFANRFAS